MRSIFSLLSAYRRTAVSLGSPSILHASAISISSRVSGARCPDGLPVLMLGASLVGGAETGGPLYCRTGAALRRGGDAGAAVGVGAGADGCPLLAGARPKWRSIVGIKSGWSHVSFSRRHRKVAKWISAAAT